MKRLAAAISFAIIIIPIVAFMPWSGTSSLNEAQDIGTQTVTPAPTKADKPSYSLASATDEAEYIPDAAEVEALARMLYGEARGIASDMEKAACVWCVLNRVDDPRFPDTVLEVLEAPKQFNGYSADYPVITELSELTADVLTRYHAERGGETDAGRVLPAEYVFFTGDGKNNHFTAEWKSEAVYQWTLKNPYED